MRQWMKQLGTVFSLVLTLCVSLTAHAAPPQCDDTCDCNTPCDTVCYNGPVGMRVKTTCGEGATNSLCMELCTWDSDSQAAPLQEAQEQQDVSLNVCTEQVQPAITSKS